MKRYATFMKIHYFDFYKNILNIKGKNVYYWRAANESENFIPFLNTSNYYPILEDSRKHLK